MSTSMHTAGQYLAAKGLWYGNIPVAEAMFLSNKRLLFLHFPGNSDSRTKPRDHQSAWQAPWRALNPGDSFLGILPAAEIMLGAIQHSRYHWSQTAVTTSVPVPGCPQLAPHPTLTCRLRLPAQQDRTPGYRKSHSLDLSLQRHLGQCHSPWDQVWAVLGPTVPAHTGASQLMTKPPLEMVPLWRAFWWFIYFFGHSATLPSTRFHYKSTFNMNFR